MTKVASQFHSLSRRIILRFCLFTLLMSLLFGLISFALMYTLEDMFIERDVLQEATILAQAYEETGSWPVPRNTNMQLAFSKADLPEDFRAIAIEEPQRKEFFGAEGRHYHLYRFSRHKDVFLVAEVSDQLLVRPMRGGIIQFLVISGIVVTVLACIVAWLIGRRTTRPLNQLASLVGEADLDTLPRHFAQDYPNNEVGILANALEQTLVRISSALARERSFTRDVSHELRTPLAVIKNAAELSLQSSKGDDVSAIRRISKATDEMEQTVQTLLMLAREEHGSTRAEPTDLMSVLERSILDHRLLLDGKDIDIEIDDNCGVQIQAEPTLLKVVIDNIVSNVFKYTHAGKVSFAFKAHQLIVSDTGPGLSSDIASNVTDVGVKGSESTSFGFGLSIVKRLCEYQQWTLEVKSENGTQVLLTFTE